MDRNTFLGDSPVKVVVRLAVLSLVVGIILHILDITPANLIERTVAILQRIYEFGRDSIGVIMTRFLMGAMVVVPIWLIARLIKTMSRPNAGP